MKTLKVLGNGFHFIIGNGETSIWYESWLIKDFIFKHVSYDI